MKSAVFYGKHDLRIEERAMPMLGADDLLIKVHACGVCGTDVHIYEGDQGAADCPPNTVLGHEFAGEVVEVGSQVTRFAVGDTVCVDPNDWCGECFYCKSGLAHYCEQMNGIGTTRDGGFAQYVAVPQKQAYKFTNEITYAEAAMTEPVACCLHGIDLCQIKPGMNVAIIGGGMIGLIMLQLAKINGAAKLVLLEPVVGKRERAQALGADCCIDPIHEDVPAVLAANGVDRLDVAIECVGLPATIEQAISIAGKYSTVMMFGLTKPDDTITVKPFEIFQKEITLKSSFINPYTQGRAIALINAKKIDVSSMVCEIAPLDQLPEILSKPELRAKGKYIIDPWKD